MHVYRLSVSVTVWNFNTEDATGWWEPVSFLQWKTSLKYLYKASNKIFAWTRLTSARIRNIIRPGRVCLRLKKPNLDLCIRCIRSGRSNRHFKQIEFEYHGFQYEEKPIIIHSNKFNTRISFRFLSYSRSRLASLDICVFTQVFNWLWFAEKKTQNSFCFHSFFLLIITKNFTLHLQIHNYSDSLVKALYKMLKYYYKYTDNMDGVCGFGQRIYTLMSFGWFNEKYKYCRKYLVKLSNLNEDPTNGE